MNKLFRTMTDAPSSVRVLQDNPAEAMGFGAVAHTAYQNDRAADETTVLVEGLGLEMFIGVLDFEKEKPQRVSVDIEAMAAGNPDWGQDNYEDVICYGELVELVKNIAKQGHIHLVEAFAERIAQACLDSQKVKRVTVCVRKPDIVNECENVGVKITRTL